MYSCRQVTTMESVRGVTLSSTERSVIDHVRLQNHRPKENYIPRASELFGVGTFVMSPISVKIITSDNGGDCVMLVVCFCVCVSLCL